MNDIDRNRSLTTADLAAAGAPAPVNAKPGPGPEPRREYEEGPQREKRASARLSTSTERSPLFTDEETKSFRSEWDAIQIGFVDAPRQCVERGDGLVASVIQRLADGFSKEKSRLESQWDRGEDVSTEDLRVALQRYRSFFDRLLSV